MVMDLVADTLFPGVSREHPARDPGPDIKCETKASRKSTPPETAAGAVGRIVVFSYWESGLKGQKGNAASLYNQDVERELLLFRRSQRLQKASGTKAKKKDACRKPLLYS